MLAADHYPDLHPDALMPNHELLEVHRSKISLHRAKARYSYPTIRLPVTFSALAGLSTRIDQTVREGALAFLVLISPSENASESSESPALTWRAPPYSAIGWFPACVLENAAVRNQLIGHNDLEMTTSRARKWAGVFSANTSTTSLRKTQLHATSRRRLMLMCLSCKHFYQLCPVPEKMEPTRKFGDHPSYRPEGCARFAPVEFKKVRRA